jgi:hypothetical protein
MATNGRGFLKHLLSTATFCGVLVLTAYAQDPPSRVADLNYISGNVSMQPAGADDWSPAVVNRPFTTGDYLWADAGAQAELHLNNAVLRLNSQTSVGFLNLDDRMAQLRFAQGELALRIRHLEEGESFEVDTPNAAITILREGEYRFNADPNAATTFVVVRHGQVEINGAGQGFSISEGNSAQISGTDQLSYDVQYAPQPGWFEGWAEDRDAREAAAISARYLSPDVIGYQDLDAYGTWSEIPDYGPVWYPRVDAGWAPYRFGHWAWIEPWGWTWVDDAPWGFAPCHYGRWAYIGPGWAWVPGPMVIYGGPRVAVVRPVYAPALVAFIGGGNWGVGLTVGGPAVGWVPLGPREVYVPAYRVSPGYFRTVNVSNTTIVNNVNITNVYNNVYVNRNVNVVNQRYVNINAPNAVTAMPQTAFAGGRPVSRAGVTIPRAELARVQTAPFAVAPPVAPARQALAPVVAARPVARPPARALNIPVVARVAPPPAPVSFAAKQAVLQQNAGKPVDMQVIRQAAPRAATPAPPVRVAPPARAVVTPAAPRGPVFRPPSPGPMPQQTTPRPQPPARPPQQAAPQPPQGVYRPQQPPPRPPAAPQQAAPRTQPAPNQRVAPPPERREQQRPAERPQREQGRPERDKPGRDS